LRIEIGQHDLVPEAKLYSPPPFVRTILTERRRQNSGEHAGKLRVVDPMSYVCAAADKRNGLDGLCTP
jgi:hypothetical protein